MGSGTVAFVHPHFKLTGHTTASKKFGGVSPIPGTMDADDMFEHTIEAPSLSSTPDPLTCRQRQRLIELYSIQSREYSEAVALLGLVRHGNETFQRALRKVESRRIACEQIRIELHEHIAKYGFCIASQ